MAYLSEARHACSPASRRAQPDYDESAENPDTVAEHSRRPGYDQGGSRTDEE